MFNGRTELRGKVFRFEILGSFHNTTRQRNCIAVGALEGPCEPETKTEALKFPSFTKESNLAAAEQTL